MPILTVTIAFILQAASGPGTEGAAPGAHDFKTLAAMLGNIGPIAIAVLVLLLFASLYSWTVIFAKASTFRKATKESRKFVRAFRKATRLQEIAALTSEYPASPLAQVFEDVYETYKRQTGGSGPPHNITPLERTAQASSSEAVSSLERRMTWLATIGSASPFVGLFGTVMGVVDAFQGLGSAGAATLRAVAPGIAEALITTAAGLFVAVPAVVAYNQFTARIRVFASAIDDFCRELLNSLEEIPVRTQAAPRAPAEMPREAERGVYK
jgi:biopolymer transport protein TolQ